MTNAGTVKPMSLYEGTVPSASYQALRIPFFEVFGFLHVCHPAWEYAAVQMAADLRGLLSAEGSGPISQQRGLSEQLLCPK